MAAEGGRTGGGGSEQESSSGRCPHGQENSNTAVCQRSVLPGRPKAALESGVPMLLSGWHRTCHCSFESGISHAGNFAGCSRKFEWRPWRARGPFPSLLTALQRNAPAEECCIAVVVVLVDVCATLLAGMQRSSNFSSLLFVSNNLPFAMLMVLVSISECSLVEVNDRRNAALLELSYVVEGEA